MPPPEVTCGPPLRRGPFRVREIAYAPGYRQPRHSHPVASVTLLVSGAIRERTARREEAGSALSVVVKPAGVPHSDEVGPRGARTLQLIFDEHEARDVMGDASGLGGWRWLHGRPPAAALLSLLACVRGPAGEDRAGVEDRIVDALGTLPDEAPRPGLPPRWLRLVKEELDDRLEEPLPLRALAAGVGAHPVTLSRAFRRHYGCTITEYRRRERVRRAATLIDSSVHSLSRIAHATGFADHPHLCRDFREVAGVSPSRFRGLARAAGPAPAGGIPEALG